MTEVDKDMVDKDMADTGPKKLGLKLGLKKTDPLKAAPSSMAPGRKPVMVEIRKSRKAITTKEEQEQQKPAEALDISLAHVDMGGLTEEERITRLKVLKLAENSREQDLQRQKEDLERKQALERAIQEETIRRAQEEEELERAKAEKKASAEQEAVTKKATETPAAEAAKPKEQVPHPVVLKKAEEEERAVAPVKHRPREEPRRGGKIILSKLAIDEE